MLLISGLCPPGLAGGCPMGMRQAARGIWSSALRTIDDSSRRKRAPLKAANSFFINRFSRGDQSVLLIGGRVNGVVAEYQLRERADRRCPYPEVPLHIC